MLPQLFCATFLALRAYLIPYADNTWMSVDNQA